MRPSRSAATASVSISPRPHTTDLGEASCLREVIYRIAVTHIAGQRPEPGDLAALNWHGRAAPVKVTLSTDGTVTRSGAMASVLASVARDAIELLGGPDAGRLRQCGRDECTRMFIDRSHGRNRTWCGMRECGNRVNAAAYRRRQRKQQPQSWAASQPSRGDRRPAARSSWIPL